MKGDLLHNGSNYVDTTAYLAMKEVMKGEKSMEKKVGQIWKIKQNNGFDSEVLVIAVHIGYCTTVQLKDSLSGYIIRGTGKTTELGRLSYTFDDSFVKYKETISEDAIDDLKLNLAIMLDIHTNVETPAPVPIAQPIECKVDDELKIQLAGVTAERDVYKSLFEKVIEKER